jgi:sodium/hydrogen antiporter
MLGLGIFAAALAVYGLIAQRLERLGFTRAMMFVTAGALAAVSGAWEPFSGGEPADVLLVLAEIALTLVLFTDAASVDIRRLRHGAAIPARLLGPGMLLSLGLGTLLGIVLFGSLDAWESAALAAILVPTDAALGAAVVKDERVPRPIRLSLNVEAGLNDGLAVPFLLLFIAGATVTEGLEPASFWTATALQKVGVGVIVGVVIGALAGAAVRRAGESGRSSPASARLAITAVAVALFVITEELGGSGLIAAFSGGLAAGSRPEGETQAALGFADEAGAVLSAFVFFALGLAAVEFFDELTWEVCAYAILSLTLVRMLPVAISLLGSGLRPPTVAFIGWFGPRGLASVVLVLIVLDQDQELANVHTLVLVTLCTVILSIVLHGLTAAPLSRRYGAWATTLPPGARERDRAPDSHAGLRLRRSQ